MLTVAMRLLCHEKWSGKALKVIDVYTEVAKNVLHALMGALIASRDRF